MSYILEALKKAQAERQLGSAPTLDALPVHPPLIAGTRRAPAPVVVGIVAAVLALVAAGLTMHWWPGPGPAPSPAPATATAIVAAAPAPVSAVPAQPAGTPAPVFSASAPLVVAPPSSPAKEVPEPVPAAATPVIAKPAPPVAAKPVEEHLPTLRELPENVRAAIPPLAFGGYMYSNDPADRLILVDKVLRHEGEEVAPGLVLEKLLPKAAQMNYRGTRYLVPI